MEGVFQIASVTPNSGSVNGGTLVTISGNGFLSNSSVNFDAASCKIISASINQITCETTAHDSQSVDINVDSNPAFSNGFTYDSTKTPTILSVNPTSGIAGDTITVSTQNVNENITVINLGSYICTVQDINADSITCTVGSGGVGNYPVSLMTSAGNSNNDIMFTFPLAITSLSSVEGTTAGGLELVINGQGFSSNSSVSICNIPCPIVKYTSSQITCTVSVFY